MKSLLRWAWLVTWCAILVIVLIPTLALAAEAPPAGEPVWWGNVPLWEIVAALAVFAWGLVKAKYSLKAKWGEKILTFLEVGVQQTYDEFVRSAKATADGGKLTKEQIAEAREMAWKAAKGYAAEQGVDLVKEVATEQIPILIGKIVQKLKGKKKEESN